MEAKQPAPPRPSIWLQNQKKAKQLIPKQGPSTVPCAPIKD